jgi:hypothetical protein
MTNVVDSYRRSHPVPAPAKSRSLLMVAALLGLMAVGAAGAAYVAYTPELPTLAATATAPLHAPAPSRKADDMAVGSTSKLPHALTTHGILDGPITGLIIVGIGLMTGLMVYLGLGRLLPAVNEPAPHPYQLVKGRREVTQERRYHGGPIRD